MNKAIGVLVLCVAVALCSEVAQGKPNFAGEWKLNVAKSDFGPMPAPTSMVQKVTHNDPTLKVVRTQVGDQGEFTTDSTYTTDGKECVNTTRMGESKSTLKWDGDTLVIDTKLDFQGNAVSITSRWTLSADGKTLTLNQRFSSQMGDAESTLVLEKQ